MQEELYSHRKDNFTFLFLLTICIFFMTVHLESYVHTFKNLLYYVFFPTQESSEQIFRQSQKLSFNIQDIIGAHQENLMLHKQLERYVQLDSEWMKEKEENARLREILGFEKPQKNKTIVARIVSREPGSWFQWVIIDKGASEGLSVDVPILMIKDGMMCVVGRVGETFDHSSKVILLTNALFAIPGMLSSTKGDGLVEGQNNPYLKMNYLLSREKLERGEIVVTSPLSSVVPEDIAIGRIKSVEPQTDETFSSAIVEPLIDLGSLREVIALLPENDNPGKRALQRSRNEPNIFQKNKKKSDLK